MITPLQHNELMARDEAYQELFLLKVTLESLLNRWGEFPTRPLEPHYKARLGDADYAVGNFFLKRAR